MKKSLPITTVNLKGLGENPKFVGGEHEILENLSRITIFIGKNNSGKSRLIRSIYAHLINKSACLGTDTYPQLKPLLWQDLLVIQNQIVDSFHENHIFKNSLLQGVDFTREQIVEEIKSSVEAELRKRINRKFKFLRSFMDNFIDLKNDEKIYLQAKEFDEKYQSSFLEINTKNHNVYYIPILRGLRPLLLNDEGLAKFDENSGLKRTEPAGFCDLYARITRLNYFPQASQAGILKEDSIFTGLSLGNTVKHLLLGNHNSRETLRAYEDFLSREFFDGEQIVLTPEIQSNRIKIKIGSNDDRLLSDLGDGIQNLIICTFLPFINQHGYYFIEEPDLFLHPDLQRKLVEILGRFKYCQFILTTHSNHLLDFSADYDAACYYVYQDGDEHIVDQFDLGELRILRNLGVRHSSSFLVNATIWVEGVTDRMYLRHYLYLYQKNQGIKMDESFKHMVEGTHFSFVEYSGTNITHLSYLEEGGIDVERLCGDMFLVADNDGCNLERVNSTDVTKKNRRNGHPKKSDIGDCAKKLESGFICLKVEK